MSPFVAMLRRAALTMLLLTELSSAATSITPTNSSITDTSALVNLTVTVGGRSLPQSSVLALSSGARDVQSNPQRGDVFLATTNNYPSVTSYNVVFISCDNATTNIDALTIYSHVASIYPAAIVFYSATSNWCQPQPIDSFNYHYVFSMTNLNDTGMLLYGVMNRALAASATVGNQRNSSDATDQNGPPPGTALAMIILYAITGTITALFIVIIITGTVRAHRHPERYGPTTVDGRPKRTRAGGLARAMLDTIPVVKFGERSGARHADIELGSTAQQAGPPEVLKGPAVTTEETEGIAAASSSATQTAETQGCSICTEDFELGQDQRVLPCEHCFHPACIDPWLLNVSGTCPLCRVDLHPAEEEPSATSEPDSATRPPATRRRSVLMAITGLRRPDGMSREERLQALRRYRMAQQSEEPQAEAGASAETQTTEVNEEGQTRQRLRQLFNIRTRRTTPAES